MWIWNGCLKLAHLGSNSIICLSSRAMRPIRKYGRGFLKSCENRTRYYGWSLSKSTVGGNFELWYVGIAKIYQGQLFQVSRSYYSLGGYCDSFYEYLLKQYLLRDQADRRCTKCARLVVAMYRKCDLMTYGRYRCCFRHQLAPCSTCGQSDYLANNWNTISWTRQWSIWYSSHHNTGCCC